MRVIALDYDNIYTSTPLHAHFDMYMCTHEHASDPLHARGTDIYMCARLDVRVDTYTHAPRIHTFVHACSYEHAPTSMLHMYTHFSTHEYTSVYLHAHHTLVLTHV